MLIRTTLLAVALAAAATAGVQAQSAHRMQSANNLKQITLAYGGDGQVLRIADARNAPDTPLTTLWSAPSVLAAATRGQPVLMTYAQGGEAGTGARRSMADPRHDAWIDVLSIDFTRTGLSVSTPARTPRRAEIEDARYNLQLGGLASQADPRTGGERAVLILRNDSDRAWSGALSVRVETAVPRERGSALATGRRTYEPLIPNAGAANEGGINVLNWSRVQIPAGGAIALPVPVSAMREVISLHIGQAG